MTRILNDPTATTQQVVGNLDRVILSKILGHIPLSFEVIMTPGVIRHINSRHPGVIEAYYHLIPDVIASPDFVGQHPSKPNTIELYSHLGPLLLAITVSPCGSLYLTTLFDLQNSDHKIAKRLKNGRILLYPFVQTNESILTSDDTQSDSKSA